MRMWMVNPEFLCRSHLLGEHGEHHKFRHNFVKQHSINKRIEYGQIEPASMELRHNQLAAEMLNRGYNHNSSYTLPDLSYLPEYQREFKVDTKQALQDLLSRCPECRERFNKLNEGDFITCHKEQHTLTNMTAMNVAE